MKNLTIRVEGMHCPSCVALLTEEFSKVAGVHHTDINLKKGTADLFYEAAEPEFNDLVERASRYGYTVKKNGEKNAAPGGAAANLRSWILGAAGAALCIGLFAVLNQSGILEGLGAARGAGQLWLALLAGVAASFTSCFAVTGSLVIAFGSLYGGADADRPVRRAFRANALFHAGRLGAFFLLGGLLGAVGGSLAVSGRILAIIMFGYALLMVVMGLFILGLGRVLKPSRVRMPGSLKRSLDRLRSSTHPLAPAALGAVTFFLPCGFTQSMQVLALGAGGFLPGAGLMLLFALGTTPVLFAAGVTSSWTRFKGVDFLRKTAGILVIAFAGYTAVSAASLADFQGDVFSASGSPSAIERNAAPAPSPGDEAAPQATPEPKPARQVAPSPSPQAAPPADDRRSQDKPAQRVEMRVTYRGFEPSTLRVKAGAPVEWVIFGEGVTACTDRIIVPSLKLSKEVKPGVNTVLFLPEKPGRVPFSCWMGMVRGMFIVE